MKNPEEQKRRGERLLDGLVNELQAMSDTDALEGENTAELIDLGERLLRNAREEAGKLRFAEAKRRLSVVSDNESFSPLISATEAREYLKAERDLTLAARDFNELSDSDVLDLYRQAMSLKESPKPEDGRE